MYWTATIPYFGPTTMCERCALLALNMAALGFVRRPFGSMDEGMAELNRRSIDAGLEPLDIFSSPFGVCGNCGEDNPAPLEAAV